MSCENIDRTPTEKEVVDQKGADKKVARVLDFTRLIRSVQTARLSEKAVLESFAPFEKKTGDI